MFENQYKNGKIEAKSEHSCHSPVYRWARIAQVVYIVPLGISSIETCAERGVEIKWFGAKEPVGFTSSWESWQYIKSCQTLPRTRKTLDFMCDFRIPLTFTMEDCKTVAAVIN